MLKQLTRGRLIGLIALILVILFVFYRCSSGNDEAPDYQTFNVAKTNVIAKVSTTGTMQAVVTVDVGTQVSGRILELYADFNSKVKKGEKIAKIDPALFQATVVQADANVVAARANVTKLTVTAEDAERAAKRASEVYEQKLISETERDTAVATARAARASVDQAVGQLAQSQAALQQARTNLQYTDIISPTDGVVISRAVNVGQTVAASLQAPVIFTIAQDLAKMEVHTNVAESDIGRLKADMRVSFTVDAYPGEQFRGTIREIRNAPQVVQNVVTYDAVIDISNDDLKLKPGMTATVSIVTDRRHDVLAVPNAALRFKPDNYNPAAAQHRNAQGQAQGSAAPAPAANGNPAAAENGGQRDRSQWQGGQGQGNWRRQRDGDDSGAQTTTNRTLFVLVNGKPEPREVTTGISDGRVTEITGGSLKEGDNVIVTAGPAGAGQGQGQRGGGQGQRGGGFRIL